MSDKIVQFPTGPKKVAEALEKAKTWMEVAPNSVNKCVVLLINDAGQAYEVSYILGGMRNIGEALGAVTLAQAFLANEAFNG